MDLLKQTCIEESIDIGIIQEPNKNMAKSSASWILDKRGDAAIYIPHGEIKIHSTGGGGGYV